MDKNKEKNRILKSHPYRIPWWKWINWDVVMDLACWVVLGSAILAITIVILCGSFLREIFG